MKIILNNNEEVFDEESLSVNQLILKKNFTFKMLVTKINDKVIKRDERDSALVKDGDQVMILHLISGG